MKIDQEFAAFILIDILFERGLINKTTYDNVRVLSETPSPLFYWLFPFPKFHFHLYFSVTFTTFRGQNLL